MKTEIENAIKTLATLASKTSDSGDAMRFTQAVQNLTNALCGIAGYEESNKRIARM